MVRNWLIKNFLLMIFYWFNIKKKVTRYYSGIQKIIHSDNAKTRNAPDFLIRDEKKRCELAIEIKNPFAKQNN